MRVGVITTSYPRQEEDPAGGFVAGHVRWLRERGHAVDVVCAGDAATPHQAWLPGVRVLAAAAPARLFYDGGAPDALDRARAAGALASAATAARVARFSASLAGAVARRAWRWDRMIAHWLVPCAVMAALAPARAPLVAVAHSGDVHLARRLGLTAPLAALLVARGARLAFVSEELRQRFLAAIGHARLQQAVARASLVTPMGIDAARFARLHDHRARARPGARPSLLFLGRLVPIKGVEVLIDAIAALERLATPPGPVVIAGDGPLRAALVQRAAQLGTRIRFPGEVRGPARDRLLAQADMLIIPSVPAPGGRSEGSPVVALEAMAAGVPVVASRTGGLASLPAGTVRLVPPGDAAALATAIQRCHTDHAARAEQVRVAARHAARLDWAHVGPRLLAGR